MILRSVVGKLWLTIIILVSLVLTLLSLFTSEQVEKTYLKDQEVSLRQLAADVQEKISKSGSNNTEYLHTVYQISQAFDTNMSIINPDGTLQNFGNKSDDRLLTNELKGRIDLKKILQGETIEGTIKVSLNNDGESSSLLKNDVQFIAVPYLKGKNKEKAGAILFYQTQDQLIEQHIKSWIFYSALIGIALTTVFAFFLSTRITQPLIQIQKAADKMARGELETRVFVRSHERDEIADLGLTFNRMAAQLEESINLLSHEKEQLTSIVRSMIDGVISLNAHGKVILTNPPAEQLLSLYRKQVEGFSYASNSLPPKLQHIFETVMDLETEQTGDVMEVGRTWAFVMAPLYARNQLRGAVAVFRDVTEQRKLDKLRKDFVANISHELRTPLSMLQGYSEALLDDIADTPEARRDIAQVINDESLRMSRLVAELLDLAKMESGNIELSLSRISMKPYLTRVVRKFQNLAREQELDVTLEFHDPLPDTLWDEDKVEQILTNLIGNAIRHTPNGGKVTLRTFWDQSYVYLEVEDTGTGIPEEDVPFVFERFYKADKARTRDNSSGTGLGLSIVKHLVQAHGGLVTVRSKVGVGTTFSVQLPQEAPHTDDTEELIG